MAEQLLYIFGFGMTNDHRIFQIFPPFYNIHNRNSQIVKYRVEDRSNFSFSELFFKDIPDPNQKIDDFQPYKPSVSVMVNQA